MPYAAEADDGRDECPVCGMYIDLYQKTACEIVYKDGKRVHACGVACMLRIVNDKGGPDAFSSITVRDWTTGQTTPADKAFYVIGSNVVPDMIPNIIAFSEKKTAEEFKTSRGGEMMDFTQALLSISPMGQTNPTKIPPAVLPPRGAFGVGMSYMYMVMDQVKLGSDSVDPDDFIKRPGQKKGPKKMTSSGEMLMANYGILDNLTLGISASYLDKKMESYINSGAATMTTENSGFGDIPVTLRYNVWRNPYYSKFFSILAGITLPTGEFDEKFVDMPGLQLGTGALTTTGGLLFSHRYKSLWFHYLATYRAVFENGDEYKFGDTVSAGAAFHYTPNYNTLLGIELDASYTDKDEFHGDKMGSTGGYRSNLTAVVDWRFLTALGGNFSLRFTGGIPLYEDLNHYSVGAMEKAKLGGGYYIQAQINFRTRFLHN